MSADEPITIVIVSSRSSTANRWISSEGAATDTKSSTTINTTAITVTANAALAPTKSQAATMTGSTKISIEMPEGRKASTTNTSATPAASRSRLRTSSARVATVVCVPVVWAASPVGIPIRYRIADQIATIARFRGN